jgi:hypothetical protein
VSARDFDDEDDSLAANPEEPRADLGYQPAPVRPVRTEKPREPDLERCSEGKDCPGHKVMPPLFQRPRAATPERKTCMTCVGRLNREHVERIRDAIRDLKAAAATGQSGAEYDAMERLRKLVGDHQAAETIKAIRDTLAQKPAAGGRR